MEVSTLRVFELLFLPPLTQPALTRKHVDKHNRPYICDEAGCEKVQGFTYPNGLLRHQREVHKQHGGPKALRMCPFPDCKRSTGTGFSRKENLNEHLRRVHRGAGISSDDVLSTTRTPLAPHLQQQLQQQPNSVQPRKRRRAFSEEEDADDAAEDESGDLQAQIKKLKQEVKEKDARLMNLEALVHTMLQRQNGRVNG